jgi:hypothetical protein
MQTHMSSPYIYILVGGKPFPSTPDVRPASHGYTETTTTARHQNHHPPGRVADLAYRRQLQMDPTHDAQDILLSHTWSARPRPTHATLPFLPAWPRQRDGPV